MLDSAKLTCFGVVSPIVSLAITLLIASCLPAVAKPIVPAKPTPSNFQVVGTEPFWGVTISDKAIVLRMPDRNPTQYPAVTPTSAEGQTLEHTMIYNLSSTDRLLLTRVAPGSCSDGMSDRKYPYSATLIRGKQVWVGCAYQK